LKRFIFRNLCLAICALCLIIFTSGCATMLAESWSINYALASNGAKGSLPEINDGKYDTLGVMFPPKREFEIILSEERQINRVVVYCGNVLSYELYCLDIKNSKWIPVSSAGERTRNQKVYSDKYNFSTHRFDHRINFKTNKIKLIVDKAAKDGVITTRTPRKNDKILNQRTEYIQVGRDRVRIDLYDVYAYNEATIREIEVYSYVEKPKPKTK
jgi:hypothetical protein